MRDFFVEFEKQRVTMDKEKLKLIVHNLELLVDSLKSEIYSDTKSYLENKNQPLHDYDEIFYDDDGYPD